MTPRRSLHHRRGAVFLFVALMVVATAISKSVLAACANPADIEGAIVYNSADNVLAYCDGTDWRGLGAASAKLLADPCDPVNSPVPGQACADGSVYAGLSPDGNVPMYTTPAEAGQFSWNDGSGIWVDTAMINCNNSTPGPALSCQTGEANTALLVGLGTTPSPAPYVAARHCSDLAPPTAEAFGHDDWYLPAQDELYVLFDNRVSIGGFNLSGSFPIGWYWSSSENFSDNVRGQNFGTGGQGNHLKSNSQSVRCVRKGYVASGVGEGGCTNPTAIEGEIFYNKDSKVPQYCAGGTWVALAEPGGSGGGADPCNPVNSPAPGQLCDDGSKYAGLSPDGNVAMYTTPADAGLFTWNDGSTFVDTAMQNCQSLTPGARASCQTGEANTALLVELGAPPSPAPYVAARHCGDLAPPTAEAFGHDDWYLPASDELNVLYGNRVATGGFNVSGSFPAGWYWSSSEDNLFVALSQRFDDGLQSSNMKSDGFSVRCVRKGYVAGSGICSNPTDSEGAIIYNADARVHQFCDGANWRAFSLARP